MSKEKIQDFPYHSKSSSFHAPSEKQLSFAKKISDKLKKELPDVKTRQSLFIFIRDNVGKYRRIKDEEYEKWQKNKPKWLRLDDPSFDDFDEDSDFMWVSGYDPYTGGVGD